MSMNLTDIMEDVKRRLVEEGTPARFARWSSVGQEDIYTSKGPVSLFLTAVSNVDPTSHLQGVVVEDRFRLELRLQFMLTPKGKKSPAVVAAWNELLKSGSARIEGLGDLPLVDKKRFIHSQDVDYGTEDFKNLAVARGLNVLKFLRPCYDAWVHPQEAGVGQPRLTSAL
jgi:hypothetical protein